MTTFDGERVTFWMLFAIGAAFLIGAPLSARQPVHVDDAIVFGFCGVGLWLYLPLVVRQVRIERGGVVVERLLWRRIYPFRQVQDVEVVYQQAGLFRLPLARLKLMDGSHAGLGPVRADGEQVAGAVREALEQGRLRPVPDPEPLSLARRLLYLALVLIPAGAVTAACAWLALLPSEVDAAAILERSVVLDSVVSRRGSSDATIELRDANGRVYRLAGPVDISIAPLEHALRHDARTPFTLVVDRTSWTSPWSPPFGDERITYVFAIRRGANVFLTLEHSAREIADDRRLSLLFVLALTIGALACAYGIVRAPRKTCVPI